VVDAGGAVVEILATKGFLATAAVTQADLIAWIGAYHLPVTTVKDPDALQGQSIQALYRREIAYIIDLSTMKIVDRIDGDVTGQGASAITQAIPRILTLLGSKQG
jgi:hypothetical protein